MCPFTILELSNPSHAVPELHEIRRSTDYNALEFGKVSWGSGVPDFRKQGNFENLSYLRSAFWLGFGQGLKDIERILYTAQVD